MQKVRHVDFHPDEWLAGTSTLDVVDVGIYITACAMIYSHGGSVEKSELKRFVRCHGKTFDNALTRLVEAGKLTLDGGQIGSKRCANELEKARKRIANSMENGCKGGRPPKKINGLDKPAGSFSEKLTTNHQPPKDSEDPYGSPGADAPEQPAPPALDPLKELWERGVLQLGNSSRSLIGKARREFGDLAVMAAIIACENACPSGPVEFFLKCLETRNHRGNGKQQSAVAKLYEGAFIAAEEWERRQGNSGDNLSLAVPLLDRRRPH